MAFPSSWHVAWAARPTLDASPTRTAGRSTRHVTAWRASPRGPSAFDKGQWDAQDLRRRRTLIGRPLLTDVSGFTTSLRAGEHGEVMVLTDQNRVVGLPRDSRSQKPRRPDRRASQAPRRAGQARRRRRQPRTPRRTHPATKKGQEKNTGLTSNRSRRISWKASGYPLWLAVSSSTALSE